MLIAAAIPNRTILQQSETARTDDGICRTRKTDIADVQQHLGVPDNKATALDSV